MERLDIWLNDARANGIYGMRRFVTTLRQDIEGVRNAVLEPWSNGQTEGRINRLKTLKRAMYGRAGVPASRSDAAAAGMKFAPELKQSRPSGRAKAEKGATPLTDGEAAAAHSW